MKKLGSYLTQSPFLLGILVIALSSLYYASFGLNKPRFLASLDNRVTDLMFHLRGVEKPSGRVVIVDIDEKSLAALGQWPWPRNVMADLVQKIGTAGARSIGFDMVFAEPDRTSPERLLNALGNQVADPARKVLLKSLLDEEASKNHDQVLGDVVASTPAVLGYVFQTKQTATKRADAADKPFPSILIHTDPADIPYQEISLPEARTATLNILDIAQAETEGFFNVFPDPSGTVRKVPLLMAMDGIPYPSMALEVARIGQKLDGITIHISRQKRGSRNAILGISMGQTFLPTDYAGHLACNYRGPAGTFRYLSAIDVLNGREEDALRDRFVVIGTSAAGLLDMRSTPFSSVCPGVEINATVVDNLLQADPMAYDFYTEIGLSYFIMVGGGLLLTIVLCFGSPLVGSLLGLLLLSAIELGNYRFFFLDHRIVGLIYPSAVLLLLFVVVTIANYFFEGREKRFIHSAFGHYVAPSIVNELVKHPEKLSLLGEQKVLTVFFSDIRGFTSLSEKMNPEELGRFMNEYLTAMSEVVLQNQGTVDKYIGDAVMAIWGAPQEDENHAEHAVRASLQMLEVLKKLQPAWQQKGYPQIDIGIGLNTGQVSVGNFGSGQRFDYTVLGDHVNLASRLEGANKIYGTNIIISEFTREAIGEVFFCRLIDLVRMKGKKQPVKIYQPLSEGQPSHILLEEVRRFEAAIAAYQKRNFTEAENILRPLAEENPCRLYTLYLDRLQAFSHSPPPEDWDGAFSFTTK